MDQIGQWDEDLDGKRKYEEFEIKIASYMSPGENHLSDDLSSI